MKDFSKTHITFLVLFLITGLAGGYFWYWSVNDLETSQKARTVLQKKLSDVEKKALPPTTAVLNSLEANKKSFDELAQKPLEELKATAGLFDSVVQKQEEGKPPVGIPSDAWKKLMNEKRAQLDEIRVKNKVEMNPDPYYGFQRYRLPSPQDQFTGQLGIQLLGLNEISSILLESKVKGYAAARRAAIEDPKASPGGAGSSDETLAASVLSGPDGLYQIYPFEVEFKCSTPVLRMVINRINQSKYFYVIRFLVVENEKANVQSRSAIQSSLQTAETQSGRLVVPVAGDEFIKVRMRIDMLVWSKPKLGVDK